MPRIVLGLEYNGASFCGWQTQPARCAVQDSLEAALTSIADEDISTVCAGRTDAGVHALYQVVHFDTVARRPESAWVRGVNASLPDAAAVMWSREVDEEFHARYSATARHYRYILLTHKVRAAVNHGRVGWFHAGLDLEAMRRAALCLVGEHDFSAFRSSECQAKSPVRELRRIDIRRNRDYVVFDLVANAFLHHMVRNIVGSLLYVGSARKDAGWLKAVLECRDRAQAAPTIEAGGLYLAYVSYDVKWALPGAARPAWFDEKEAG